MRWHVLFRGFEAAWDLVVEMRSSFEMEPEAVTHNILLDALVKCGRLNEALRFFWSIAGQSDGGGMTAVSEGISGTPEWVDARLAEDPNSYSRLPKGELLPFYLRQARYGFVDPSITRDRWSM
jgi:hypothetical protein